MMTSPKQTLLFIEETLTSSPEDSHANHTHPQENERARRMRDISGRRCLEQLEKLPQVGSWAKTFMALLIGQEGWYSTKCKLTWKLRGTRYSRFYCQLFPSMLHIEETEYGLLPTPKTMDVAENLNSGKECKMINGSIVNVRKKDGMKFGPSLNDAMKAGLLPTPRVKGHGNSHKRIEDGRIDDLTTMAKFQMLPTPATRDWKGARTEEALEKAGRNHTNSLPDSFAELGKTSHLSPQFVLEMMGFPTDWTLLPFLNGETSPSKQEETQ